MTLEEFTGILEEPGFLLHMTTLRKGKPGSAFSLLSASGQ